jgi:DNA polymerase III epsilon subunit-like protein
MKDSDLNFIGVDLETSGSSHEDSAPIQVGIANDSGMIFDSYIGGWSWVDGYVNGKRRHVWSDEAFGIHGIPKGRLYGMPSADLVDAQGAYWIEDNVGGPSKGIIAVGWNVAAFDFPFIREYLPRTAASMAYRSVDLNAIIFGITQAGLADESGKPWTYYRLKSVVKDAAAARILAQTDKPMQWHDAGYDALAGLYAFYELQDVLQRAAGYPYA